MIYLLYGASALLALYAIILAIVYYFVQRIVKNLERVEERREAALRANGFYDGVDCDK